MKNLIKISILFLTTIIYSQSCNQMKEMGILCGETNECINNVSSLSQNLQNCYFDGLRIGIRNKRNENGYTGPGGSGGSEGTGGSGSSGGGNANIWGTYRKCSVVEMLRNWNKTGVLGCPKKKQ